MRLLYIYTYLYYLLLYYDRYDTVHNVWIVLTHFPTGYYGVSNSAVFAYGESLHVVGGYDQNYASYSTNTVVDLQTINGSIITAAPMPVGTRGVSVTCI